MEIDQVVTWLKQRWILDELRKLADKPSLKQRRAWRERKRMLARLRKRK